MNPTNPEDQAEQIKSALFGGRKIEAIKLYREQTRASLSDAKDAVEKLEAELRVSSPDQFTSTPAKGCVSVLMICVSACGGVLWLFFRS